MELGEKIKQARLALGLSQRQLCGDVITRNMLSLIEAGRARPGMDTLTYLAGRLGKPISYFLEEQAVTFPNQPIMDTARKFYAVGAYKQVIDALEDYCPDGIFDSEKGLLDALCRIELARKALEQGKPAYAAVLLEQAGQVSSPYYSDALERQRLLLMAQALPEKTVALVQALPGDFDRELLMRARAAFQQGDHDRCIALANAAQESPERELLYGQAASAKGDFANAKTRLHRAEATFPKQCAPLLERCYRELEDYKMAYEYACKQR